VSNTWVELWNLLKGYSPLSKALRAMIYYMVGLVVIYIVGLVNHDAWALLTIILLVSATTDFAKNSEASYSYLKKRLPAALGTLFVAVILSQTLDYLFSGLFVLFFALKVAQRHGLID